MIEISEDGGAVGVMREGAILCNICYNIVYRYCEEECAHAFCVDCMKGYLRECIRSDTYFIKCPEWDCNSMITNNTIKAHLSPK